METEQIEKPKILYYDCDLIKTSISGISEEQVEECVNKIVSSNSDVNFAAIQYSKRNRRVLFYTNNYISTKEWQPPKRPAPKSIKTITEVLEEIKRVFTDEKQEENSCMSIYDNDSIISLDKIISLTRQKNKEYEQIKDKYEEKLKYAYRDKVGDSAHIYISDYDYVTDVLKISTTHYSLGNYSYFLFKKDVDGDLKGKRESGFYDLDEVMISCGRIISDAHDELKNLKDFKQQACRRVKPVNSRFSLEIDSYGVEVQSDTNVFSLNFRSYSTEDKYECNSQNVIELLKGNEMALASKILVRIDECPEWMHGTLYEMREKELTEIKEQRKREEQAKIREQERQQKQETKQEKVKELKKRFLPFLKSK